MPEDKPEKPESEDKPKARPGSAAPSRGKDAPVAKKDAAGTKKDAPPGTKSAGDKQKSGGPGSLDVKTVRLIIGGLVAAALVVPDRAALRERLGTTVRALARASERRLETRAQRLDHAQRRLVHPAARIAQQGAYVTDLARRLARCARRKRWMRSATRATRCGSGITISAPAPRTCSPPR